MPPGRRTEKRRFRAVCRRASREPGTGSSPTVCIDNGLQLPLLDFTLDGKQGIDLHMKKVLLVFVIIVGIIVVLGAAGAFGLYYWASRDLPGFTKIADYRPALATTVLARDGSVLGYLYREKRFMISLEDMPKELPRAFLAAEDAEFYQHDGVDPEAILRAFIVNMQSGTKRQGGSTITQQVIKRLLLTPERSYERKIKEAILAFRLERYLTKDEILTIYLNQTFLGANAYGVEAAARTYFGKHAKELTIAECAVIAGLPQAPSRYNPYLNREAAISRQHYVLRRLKELSWITESEYDEALRQPLVFRNMLPDIGNEGAWYLEEIRRQLIDLFSEENARAAGLDLHVYGEDAVYQLGLVVQTAMDPKAQLAADKALRSGLEKLDRTHGWRGPIERIAPDQLEKRLAEAEFVPTDLVNGNWAKGIVSKISEKGLEVRLGAFTGFVEAKNMSWARRAGTRLDKQFGIGDVIWVSGLGKDAKSTYDPAEVTTEKPIRLALQSVPELQGALVSLDPRSGDVVAMCGGYSAQVSQFNRATQAKRQPGSSFKPIVYSAALDKGFTPATVILDAPVVQFMEDGDIWRPANYEKGFKGPILMRTALALSRNLCTIRVAQQIGVAAVVERARDLGIEGHLPEVLSISLGSAEVTPLNLAQAYTAFANGGMVSRARFILSVKNFWGETLYEPQPDLRDAISPQNAYLIASMLKDVVTAGTGSKAAVLGRPLGGKTGTSNEERDAWFMGVTPYLVTGVYVGYDQQRSMGKSGSGSSAALPIFIDYAKEVFPDYPPDDFPVPDGITFVDVDSVTGYRAGADTAKSLHLPFYEGTEPGAAASAEILNREQSLGEDLLKQF